MLLRQLVMPIVFVFYMFSKKNGSETLSAFFVVAFSMVLAASCPKPEVAYLWIAFCLGMYVYGDHVSGDHVFAACFAVLSTHFGGWLYEVPFWHPTTMFYSFRYPWVVNTQILSGVFCVYLLWKRGFKVNKTMIYAVLGYVMMSFFWGILVNPIYQTQGSRGFWWVPRVGTMFLLWSALTGIVGETKR